MIPASLIGLLPVALSDIEAYASRATWLAWKLGKLPNPLEFFTAMYRHYKGTTRAQAKIMYRVAKYFRDQAEYLAHYGMADIIDPRLSGLAYVSSQDYHIDRPLRYAVEIKYRSPALGVVKTYTIYVEAGYQDTVGDVIVLAANELQRRLSAFYKVDLAVEVPDELTTDFAIAQFHTLSRRGTNVRIPA